MYFLRNGSYTIGYVMDRIRIVYIENRLKSHFENRIFNRIKDRIQGSYTSKNVHFTVDQKIF